MAGGEFGFGVLSPDANVAAPEGCRACAPAGVASLVSSQRRSVVIGAYRRHVVRYVLALLVLSQAAGCGDDPSPTAPTPIQVAGNRAPSASGAIPAQTLAVDGAMATMDVAPYFVDPDGDTLTYAAVSSDAAVATASISGSTVMLTPVGLGTAVVTVTATDPGGLTATQPVTVAVGQDDLPTTPGPQANADLVVASPSVSDRRPAAGATFTLSATVRNDGNGDAAATTLRYYHSSDSAITASDTEVGTDAVAALTPSGTGSASADLTAPAAGTYYYGACVDAVVSESDTTNNCSASVQVEVPEPPPPSTPDLVVASPSVSDSGPATGASFTLSATVRNDGDGNSTATTVRFYRSADATVTTSDAQVGTDTVAALAASGRASASADLTAPAAGTYYYGACVDAVVSESDTTNNCSASVQVEVPEPPPPSTPDLVVASPSVSDSGPATGASFTLSATVRNDGNGDAAATTLRYYHSSDSAITASDTEVGTDAVAALTPSGTGSASADLTAPAAGTYYYGACVDAVVSESDTTNNCSASVQVEVPEPPPPSTPDLVVASPSVSDSGPATGASFTLSATVRNDGNGDAAATTLRYYHSSDSAITASDTEVGTDAVAALTPSGTGSASADLTAPAAGTYYYGACVDAVVSESDTTNNCSASVQVEVPEPPPPSTPDLVVASPSVSDSGPATGASFTLSATVRNDGNGDAAATTLRYYRSSDSTITTADAQVGTDAVAALTASGSGNESVDLTAPSSAGRYYYGACVDAVASESDTTNNCSGSVQVDVTEPPPPSNADLVVVSPSVSDRGPAAGASFTLSATVRNDGNGDAAATTLRYYRSSDSTITTADAQVGTDAVAALTASGSGNESVDLTAPSSAGRYYYGACVDAVASESDTTNNCSGSVQVDVTEPPPPSNADLVVVSPSVSDRGPAAGASFTLSATVRNDGNGDAAATTLRYYRSSDSTITTADAQVGTDAVAALTPSGTGSESVDLTAPSSAGRYYYGACVDAVASESDTTNNCSGSVQVDVTEPPPPSNADLVVVSPSVSDRGPAAGASFTLSATVRNDGNGDAAATTLRYYRSSDSTITTADAQVGTDAVAALTASGSGNESVDLTAPSSAGRYYYGACVDAVASESDTTNNCSGSVQVDVTEPPPPSNADLVVVSPSVSDRGPAAGASFTLSATVRNDGNGDAAATTLRYYRSSDSTITTADAQVGTDAVAALTVSGSGNESVDLTAPSSAGRYYYGACVDAVAGESDTTNNCSASVQVDVAVTRASRIVLMPGSLSFDQVGAIAALTATVYDASNNEIQPTYWGWSSADRGVATVSGRVFGSLVSTTVQAIGDGTTTVTLSANGSATGSATVTVTLAAGRIELSPRSLTFDALGDTKSVTVRILDGNGDEDTNATFNAFSVFSPCCGPNVANPPKTIRTERVTNALEITAEGPGSGQITISSEGVESAILLVSVYQEPSSLEVSPDSVTLAVDGTATLRATVKDANGYPIHVNEDDGRGGFAVYWSTSDSDVATIGSGRLATVTVTGVNAGTATVTGRHGGASATGTAAVTVQ